MTPFYVVVRSIDKILKSVRLTIKFDFNYIFKKIKSLDKIGQVWSFRTEKLNEMEFRNEPDEGRVKRVVELMTSVVKLFIRFPLSCVRR